MIRNTLFLPLMAAAIGGPFLLMSGPKEGGEADEESAETVATDIELAEFNGQKKQFYDPLENLSEVFNFRQSATGVEQRFPKATRSKMNGFEIYRSSVLSGHGDQDIVGAITYEFNFRGNLKRIRFKGFVVDPSKLLMTLQNDFSFQKTDQTGAEYRPTTFSGYSGSLRLTNSADYKGQLDIELEISR